MDNKVDVRIVNTNEIGFNGIGSNTNEIGFTGIEVDAFNIVGIDIEQFEGEILSKQLKVQIYTDSESMIKKLDAFSEYLTAKCKMTVHPEWDVLSALNNILEIYLRQPTITWVESHHDENNKVTELTLDALLNIEADDLATRGLQSGDWKDRVPMDPMMYVQVHIQGRTITRDLKRTVQRIIRTEPLMKYYIERFKCRNLTCKQIDWEVFGWAYKTRIKKKFGWSNEYHLKNLPTGDRMKRRGGLDNERCCSYGAPLETDHHIFSSNGES